MLLLSCFAAPAFAPDEKIWSCQKSSSSEEKDNSELEEAYKARGKKPLNRPPAKKPPPPANQVDDFYLYFELQGSASTIFGPRFDRPQQRGNYSQQSLASELQVPPICRPGNCDSSLYTDLYLRQTAMFPKCSLLSQP